MALPVQTIGNRLLAMAAQDWAHDMTGPPNGLLANLAGVITAAEQEMRSLAPDLFSQPREKRVAAPASIAPTIAGSGATLTVAGVPNAGVTVLLEDADGGHNRILSLSSGTTWDLVRAHEGGDGATTGTLWDDCWIVADGDDFEVLRGEVMLDGKPLLRVSSESAAWMDYQKRRGTTVRTDALTPVAGTPLYYWLEYVQTDVSVTPVCWLRVFPMPSAAATLRASVVVRAAEVSTSDFSATTRKVAAPMGKEEELFMPLVMFHWAQTPWFKPDSTQYRTLAARYETAKERLIYLA